jgi:hypothetical protein
MNKFSYKSLFIAAALIAGLSPESFGGNPDRRGQAGATQLLVNPWSRSSGWNGINTSTIRGLESERFNIAGLAFVDKTELLFSRSAMFAGTVNINAFGIAQRISESTVLGLSITSFDLGEIEITTNNFPDGGIGTFTPRFSNISLSYAREFSKRIYGGAVLRLINESISDVSASGIAIDAGIQYVTGAKEQIKFGVALRNIGTPMKYGGDGLSTRATADGQNISLTISQRAEGFELPALMNIGGSYDFLFGPTNKFTIAANFTYNSFTQNQTGIGAELNLRNMLFLRAGFNYENDILNPDLRQTAYTGFATGLTVDLPYGKEKKKAFGLDYSFRPMATFGGGAHVFGARIKI